VKILVTGGCGYVGSVLVPKLLDLGHEVTVFDLQWFGNYLKTHPKLYVYRCDIRDTNYIDAEAIIHLASVADDPTSELDHEQTWEIGALGTQKLCQHAVKSGVKQFIHASSGSVYGVNTEGTEDLELNPYSYYNKVKMIAERVALSHHGRMSVQIVRPAAICGFSPRMRLEVTVNQLTIQALTTGRIKVFGGEQIRPNIHIEDITDFYIHMLKHPGLSGIYNAVFENLKVSEVAQLVSMETGAQIETTHSDDKRSYPMASKKVTGWIPHRSVLSAIREMAAKFKSGELKNEDRWYNLKMMKC